MAQEAFERTGGPHTASSRSARSPSRRRGDARRGRGIPQPARHPQLRRRATTCPIPPGSAATPAREARPRLLPRLLAGGLRQGEGAGAGACRTSPSASTTPASRASTTPYFANWKKELQNLAQARQRRDQDQRPRHVRPRWTVDSFRPWVETSIETFGTSARSSAPTGRSIACTPRYATSLDAYARSSEASRGTSRSRCGRATPSASSASDVSGPPRSISGSREAPVATLTWSDSLGKRVRRGDWADQAISTTRRSTRRSTRASGRWPRSSSTTSWRRRRSATSSTRSGPRASSASSWAAG